uniref:Tetraspanin n=1 Tax=Parastrongyloides trichosuri TaxID=131310 RepID=A0A0N4Z062_PARTI
MVNKRKKIEKPRQEICMPLKWLCFLIGFFLFLIGIILTGLGVYLIVTDIRPLQDLIDIFINPSIFITIIGFFIIFVASCAFWGSLRESSYLLKVFSFAIFLSYISTVVFAFLLFYTFYTHPDDSTSAQSIMMYAIKNYNNNRNIAEFVDYIQEQFECCGASSISQGYKDWLLNEQFSCNSSNPYPEKCSVPFSCCRRSSNTVDDENVQTNKLVPAMASFHCWRDVQDKRVQDIESRINTFGCIYPLRQLFEKNAIYLGIIVSIIIMPVCLTICLSHLLAKQIDHQKYLLEREARRFERYKRKEARQRYNEHYAAVLQTYQLNEEDETTALPTNSSDSRKQPPSQQQLIKNQPKKSITSTGGYNKSSNNHKNAANSVEAIENKRVIINGENNSRKTSKLSQR